MGEDENRRDYHALLRLADKRAEDLCVNTGELKIYSVEDLGDRELTELLKRREVHNR